MNDLAAFLRARYDEDEQVALSASDWEDDPTPWALLGPTGGYCEPALHIHRRRLLAEVDAKRRIIEAHPITRQIVRYGGAKRDFGCEICHDWDGATMGEGYCDTLKALALPYADHADYQEEWRP